MARNNRLHIPSFFAWRSGAREAFEAKDRRQATAHSSQLADCVNLSAMAASLRLVLRMPLAHNGLHAINERLSPQTSRVAAYLPPTFLIVSSGRNSDKGLLTSRANPSFR
jgi:hypothetical protein